MATRKTRPRNACDQSLFSTYRHQRAAESTALWSDRAWASMMAPAHIWPIAPVRSGATWHDAPRADRIASPATESPDRSRSLCICPDIDASRVLASSSRKPSPVNGPSPEHLSRPLTVLDRRTGAGRKGRDSHCRSREDSEASRPRVRKPHRRTSLHGRWTRSGRMRRTEDTWRCPRLPHPACLPPTFSALALP